jgi:hypothetical protein
VEVHVEVVVVAPDAELPCLIEENTYCVSPLVGDILRTQTEA